MVRNDTECENETENRDADLSVPAAVEAWGHSSRVAVLSVMSPMRHPKAQGFSFLLVNLEAS